MLSTRRLLVALATCTALLIGAAGSAHAALQVAPGSNTAAGNGHCSGVYTNIPTLRFRECLGVRTVQGGSYDKSILAVVNATRTPRMINMNSAMVNIGRLQPPYYCGNVLLRPGWVALCISKEVFVVDTRGSSSYGRGFVRDSATGRSSFAVSRTHTPPRGQ